MTRVDSIDRKLKRLRSLEAGYRRDVKTLEEALAQGRLTQGRMEKLKLRLTRKIDKLSTKIRDLVKERERT